MFRVAQADEQPLRAARFKKFFSLAVQDHERLAGFLFANAVFIRKMIFASPAIQFKTPPFHLLSLLTVVNFVLVIAPAILASVEFVIIPKTKRY